MYVDAPRDTILTISVIFPLCCTRHLFILFYRSGVGGNTARFSLYVFFFRVQQTTSGIGHRVKKYFFELAINTLNVRNNNFNHNKQQQ